MLGSSEMFNSFLRKAQQVGKVVGELTGGDLTGVHEPVLNVRFTKIRSFVQVQAVRAQY